MASIDGISLIGRPSKYKEEYCERLIEHMSQGLSYESFAGEIGMAVSTIYLWEKEHEEFSEAKKIGQAKCILWNERAMNAMTVGQLPLGKPACMIFKMKNQNGWKDTPQVIEEGKNTFNLAYNLDDAIDDE